MRYMLPILLVFSVFYDSLAQEEAELEEIVLFNPVRWGTTVYVKAKTLTKKRLLKRFKTAIEQPDHHCNTSYDDYENWYCDKEPEMFFRGLDEFGKRREEAMLCQKNKFLDEYKFLNKEMFIHYRCLVASWDSDTRTYEFHTIKEWFGEEW